MKYIQEFLKELEIQVDDLRRDARYGGEWSDGGASILEEYVIIYKHGLANSVPPCWKEEYDEFAKRMDNETDPEYNELLRLKKKFNS